MSNADPGAIHARKPLWAFQEGRAKFPDEELLKYVGRWVAFSADGSTIVASGKDLDELEERLHTLGIDPQDVVFEGVPSDDWIQHGSELS